MQKRELTYRKWLLNQMNGRWLVAIHVENHLCPGVPDLSYVIVGAGHETGWLELKVALGRANNHGIDLKIEPSQHHWMLRYACRVPTHFLINYRGEHFLINGMHHRRLGQPLNIDDLRRVAFESYTDDTLSHDLTKNLSSLTMRIANGY